MAIAESKIQRRWLSVFPLLSFCAAWLLEIFVAVVEDGLFQAVATLGVGFQTVTRIWEYD